jgi:hypothetical protein
MEWEYVDLWASRLGGANCWSRLARMPVDRKSAADSIGGAVRETSD